MSYGLRELRAAKTNLTSKKEVELVDHVIVGEDLSCLMTLAKLINAGEKVILLNSRKLSKQELINWWEKGIRYLRASQGLQDLASFFPENSIQMEEKAPLFYKDHQWRSFGGRAKSAELLAGEDYFLLPSAEVNLSKMFGEHGWADLDQMLENSLRVQHLSQLVPVNDGEGWFIECRDGSSFKTKKLYWGSNLKQLIDCHSAANDLPQAFHQYVHHMDRFALLEVYCTSKKKIYAGNETLFIPQSMTHDEGHYVVEFREFNVETNLQEFSVTCIVVEDDSQPEDLAKKVRHLKKVVERIFPELAKAIVDEKVAFHQHFVTRNIEAFHGETGLKDCVLIGKEAPLVEENLSSLQGDWGRSLASFHQTWPL